MSTFDIALFTAVVAGIVLSLTFVQRGQWWNVIQFLYVSLFLLSFHSAEALEWLIKKNNLTRLIVIIIVLSVIPFNAVVINSTSDFEKQGTFVPDIELEALDFLKEEPEGVVLILTPKFSPAHIRPRPRPLWYIPDSPYVTTYSNKPAFVGPIEILKLFDVDYETRQDQVYNPDIEDLSNKVDYVYAYGPEKEYCNYEMMIRKSGEEIFNNGLIYIYRL